MRKYHHIELSNQSIKTQELNGKDVSFVGRYLIAKTLLDAKVATVDPLSPENPLIFSAGPFAGTNFSNANRISVGCKSPLTGGIKEANAGGTFAYAMGQQEISGFTLHGASEDWIVIHFTKDGEVLFHDASPYMGKGNIEAAKLLHEKYGLKVSLSLCGPVGEYQGLMAGIAFSDTDLRPTRLAARGGVGAVMGSKKVKAMVVDNIKMPTFHDRRKLMGTIKEYTKKLGEQVPVQNMQRLGTAMMADITNYMGGLPVRNFTEGQMTSSKDEVFKMGGDFIRERNMERGGDPSHACMPGCMIKCSNVYVDAQGKESVSPIEYETLCLLGTNLGIDEPDHTAVLNEICNDLGIDTIEAGATLGVLIDSGEAEFGDVGYMEKTLNEMRVDNERARYLAQGTARVGEALGFHRVPVIKKQAISAYDPRLIEVTGISMMVTAQGADHTVGNLPAYECAGKDIKELATESYIMQRKCAIADSIGLCIFGRSVTDVEYEMMVTAMNDAHDGAITVSDLKTMGEDTLRLEHAFNVAAGFSEAEDELPQFFQDEALPPLNIKARLRSAEVNEHMNILRKDGLGV